MIYKIFFSPEADYDMIELENYIRNVLKSPITASKYINDLNIAIHSHSIVAGGFELISYTTRFTPRTLLMISFDTLARKS